MKHQKQKIKPNLRKLIVKQLNSNPIRKQFHKKSNKNKITQISIKANSKSEKIIEDRSLNKLNIIQKMMINIKLNIDKKSKNQLLPQNNNFFLENTHLNHKKKSPTKQLKSFRDHTKSEFNEAEDEREQLLTDREKKKSHKETHTHKRTNSAIKKSTTFHQAGSRHPTPSTGVSTKFSNNPSNISHLAHGNFQKNKDKQPQKKQVIKEKQIFTNTKSVNKNISDLMFKMPKKKLAMGNPSSLGDEQSLKGSIPGWSGQKVIQRFGLILTQYQKGELNGWKEVFYIGIGTGVGEDDIQGAYLWKKHQQLGFRYQLLQHLGSGAFGEVVKAFDHKNKQQVAVKIIRSKKQHMQLALNEINILMKAKQKDTENQKNILRIKDFIVFKKHICIITELLSISLYELLETNNFCPLDMTYIRTFAIQILNALAYLKEIKIVHSDLKPENVMLKNKMKTGIKIIDFGTSMFSNQTNFLYIQSRFYRAPEVILGAPYGFEIDMWSFGCLLAELYLGEPIFAGKDQVEQFALIIECLGCPEKSQQFFQKCKNFNQFFTQEYQLKSYKNHQGKVIKPKSKQLLLLIKDKSFCQYLSKILVINPKQRYNPLQALLDPWILQGLPEQVKQQHLAFIKQKMKEQRKKVQKQSDIKPKKIATDRKTHRRDNTTQINPSHKKFQSVKRQEEVPHQTVKKASMHSRRNSDYKYEQFNAKQAHLKHRRRGSTGIF